MTDLLGSTTAPTATSSTAPAATPAADSGTFPQTSTSDETGLPAAPKGISAAQFFSDYGITDSSEESTYLNSDGSLNGYASELINYYSMSQGERQDVQDAMVDAGLLTQTDATGQANSTSNDAFERLVGIAASYGTTPAAYLTQQSQGGIAQVQQQISSNLTEAQKNATTPVAVEQENPTTLAADITSAFDQALGFAPSQDQVNAFISQIQSQDTANAEAPRAEAQAEITEAQSQQSALNKLGDDGIDAFMSAYANAIHGTGVAGAGTTQGPATGTAAIPGSALSNQMNQQYAIGGPTAGAREVPAATAKTGATAAAGAAPAGTGLGLRSAANAIAGNVSGGVPGGQNVAVTPRTRTIPAHEALTLTRGTEPAVAPGTPQSAPTYGGMYALNPAVWKQAQALYSPAEKYATAGAAPLSIQQGAVTALAQHLYDTNGNSWSDVAISLAGGNPAKPSTGHVLNTSANIQDFATGVANQVNQQIEALQNEVNNQVVTVKETTPDAAAEAAQAAKEADPVGYYAANFAGWGSALTKMLYGTPLTEMPSTTDTFTGPVGSDAALTGAGEAPASTTTAAPTNTPAPAATTAATTAPATPGVTV